MDTLSPVSAFLSLQEPHDNSPEPDSDIPDSNLGQTKENHPSAIGHSSATVSTKPPPATTDILSALLSHSSYSEKKKNPESQVSKVVEAFFCRKCEEFRTEPPDVQQDFEIDTNFGVNTLRYLKNTGSGSGLFLLHDKTGYTILIKTDGTIDVRKKEPYDCSHVKKET